MRCVDARFFVRTFQRYGMPGLLCPSSYSLFIRRGTYHKRKLPDIGIVFNREAIGLFNFCIIGVDFRTFFSRISTLPGDVFWHVLWLCPFKAVTEYEKISTFLVMIQTVIFVLLFLGLVIVLPILTKKRTQCSLLCPFGAMQSLMNKINAFEVRINKDKCSHCKVCIGVCPTFSIDEDGLKTGKANLTCTRCGKCISHCPKGAISLEIKGTTTSCQQERRVRLLFLYPAFMLLFIMGSGMIQNAIYRILLLLTTGKLIH